MCFENCVYSSEMKDEFVSVNGILTRLKHDKSVLPSELAVSTLFRSFLKVEVGHEVSVEPVDSPVSAVSAYFEVEMVSKRKMKIYENELAKALKERLRSVIYTNLEMAFSFVDVTFKLKVLNSIPSSENNPLLFDENTKVELKNVESQYMSWVKSKTRISPVFNFNELGIGGLDSQFSEIFRRAFTSRMCDPEEIKELGLKHVKGIVLYGPAGTGKTLIARKIGEVLGCLPPKIVNGPEILAKFVGESEENIRNLFADAEKDEAENGINSDLHLIIFDEIDAICKTRGTVKNSTGVGDTVVNQLLTKIDGVKQLNNVLIIAMTNRFDMLDPALLRAGRLEIHIEIPIPDEEGREKIFQIHTRALRESSKLGGDVEMSTLAKLTPGLSGASIEGVIRNATQTAIFERMSSGFGCSTKGVIVSMRHFETAINDFLKQK